MYFSELPYESLRKVLLELGFTEHLVQEKYLAFDHPESDTTFLFRFYRPKDKVSMADLVTVRKQLDWRGLLTEDAFEASLGKASA